MTYAAGGGAKEDPGFGHFGYLGREEILAMVIIRLLRLLEVWMSCYRGNCVFG